MYTPAISHSTMSSMAYSRVPLSILFEPSEGSEAHASSAVSLRWHVSQLLSRTPSLGDGEYTVVVYASRSAP